MKTSIKIFTILALIVSLSIAKDKKSNKDEVVKNLDKKVRFFKKLKKEISKIKKYRKKKRR